MGATTKKISLFIFGATLIGTCYATTEVTQWIKKSIAQIKSDVTQLSSEEVTLTQTPIEKDIQLDTSLFETMQGLSLAQTQGLHDLQTLNGINPFENLLLALEEQAQKEYEEKMKNAYYITYAGKDNSPISQVKIKGQIFKNGMPIRFFETTTNEEGKFVFEEELEKQRQKQQSTEEEKIAVSLFQIESADKKKMRCSGHAIPGQKEIKVTCEPIKTRAGTLME